MNAYVSSIPHGGYGSGCCRFCDFETWPLAVGDRVRVVDAETRDDLLGTVRKVAGQSASRSPAFARIEVTFDRPRRRVPFSASDPRLRRT